MYHEHIRTIGDLTSNAKELKEVVELTVNVSTDGHGSCNGLNVGLFQEAFLHLR